MKIKINEIFASVDGEVNLFHQGCLSTFIRFQGCPLSCSWCDTDYARGEGGRWMTIEEIIQDIESLGIAKVTITGGEPLAQRGGFLELLRNLKALRYKISVETSGAFQPEGSPDCWVIDWKTPSSDENDKMKAEYYQGLSSSDFIKFPIADRQDFNHAKRIIRMLRNSGCSARFVFSPVAGSKIIMVKLVEWMLLGEWAHLQTLPVLSLQLHKFIGVR